MPLSEHEQRLLEQIERALVDDDPKFASTVRSGDRRFTARRKLQLGALLVLLGLAVVVLGAVLSSVILGVIGFLASFGGLVLVVFNFRHAGGPSEPGAAGGAKGAAGRGRRTKRVPLRNRLEERFRRRYDQ